VQSAPPRERPAREERPARHERKETGARLPDSEMETYRIEVGHEHGAKAGNIVGAIANEAGIEGQHIGRVEIREDHSFVDLPKGMPKEIFRHLQKVRVAGQMLQIGRVQKSMQRQEERTRPERPGRERGPRKPMRRKTR
jgi:ATP-dependent RNA helicase DeaD